MKFAAIALVAAVAAHDQIVEKDLKYIATELKEISGEMKKMDMLEWKELKMQEHRHHRHHHDHKRPHHGHKKHHQKENNDKLKMDIIQVEEIVTGILKGAINAEGFSDISKCMNDVTVVIGDASNAVKDFKAGGASNVIEGLKQVADLLKNVKVSMADCSATGGDWAKLEAMAKVIDSPSSFAYHVGKDLWINGQDIFADIEAAITDYESQQWEAFGE